MSTRTTQGTGLTSPHSAKQTPNRKEAPHMIEFRDDITEDERLDAQTCLDDLCDLCITNSGCCDCPVTELKRRIDEVEL